MESEEQTKEELEKKIKSAFRRLNEEKKIPSRRDYGEKYLGLLAGYGESEPEMRNQKRIDKCEDNLASYQAAYKKRYGKEFDLSTISTKPSEVYYDGKSEDVDLLSGMGKSMGALMIGASNMHHRAVWSDHGEGWFLEEQDDNGIPWDDMSYVKEGEPRYMMHMAAASRTILETYGLENLVGKLTPEEVMSKSPEELEQLRGLK